MLTKGRCGSKIDTSADMEDNWRFMTASGEFLMEHTDHKIIRHAMINLPNLLTMEIGPIGQNGWVKSQPSHLELQIDEETGRKVWKM